MSSLIVPPTVPSPSEDCEQLRAAFAGWGTNEKLIISILGHRNAAQIKLIRNTYSEFYGESLWMNLKEELSNDFELLVGLVSSYRYHGVEIDDHLAKKEATILHDKIKGNAMNHEEVIRILTTRSKAQLSATFSHYKDTFGNPIDEDLKVDSKDEYLCALKAAIQCLAFPEKYFVGVLSKAMKGLGTDEVTLTRVVVTRAEVDMKQINEEYLKVNGVGLDKAIRDDTSGDYREMLLTLIGHGDA